MPKYDAAAALDILGAYAEEKNPSGSYHEKDAAAKNLLEQLVALDGKMVDLVAVADPRYASMTVAVSCSFAGARVAYSQQSGAFVVFADDLKLPVPVRFNRARGIFEGEAVDESRVPAPGEEKGRRRDALAVIADVVVDAMKKRA
jgi:hypothetical protein